MEHTQGQVNEKPVQFLMPENINLPCIHAKKFAELNGLSEGVIGGWIDNGYLPTLKKGKYTMINLVALAEQCRVGGCK